MMEYFRNYLIFIRKKENTDSSKIKFSNQLLIISIVGVLLGILVDILLGFSHIFNSFRGIIAIITGVSLFTYGYIKKNARDQKKVSEDRFYLRIRERFSHKQRVNISIVIAAISAGVILLSEFDLFYTFKSALFVFSILTLVAFSRKRRSEFIKGINNLPDIRDLKNKKTK